MKVGRMAIKNYMPVGETPLEISFRNKDKLTLVGENNVGKSCILRAIRRCLNSQDSDFVEEEWHKGDRTRTIEIILEVLLEDEDLVKILGLLDLPQSALDEVKRDFGSIFLYSIKKSSGTPKADLKWGELSIFDSTGSVFDIDLTRGFRSVPWSGICSEYTKTRSALKAVIKEEISKHRDPFNPSTPVRIDFGRDLRKQIVELLSENIISFPEFRVRSNTAPTNRLVSPTGLELASVLFNLKNGGLKERSKFKKIQQHFTQLFPGLELEVVKEKDGNKISVHRDGIESTTDYFGAGVFEMILFTTHLIAHDNKLLCIDEPELHLHPHAQKLLASFIKESDENQFIIITHSPFFIDLSLPNNVVRVVQKDEQISLIYPPSNYWTPQELEKLNQFLDADNLELFFARKVLLVEGPTETAAFPIFSKHISDFLKNGVSTIEVGGKKSFPLFIKLLKGFEIPYVVVLDKDANDPKDGEFQVEIKNLVKDAKRVIILPGKFEDVVEKHQPELLKEAEEKIGKSKPRIGRYVALELIKKEKIPPEFLEVINAVKECK